MQTDYTLQLEEIVKALNHQATPTWLIAIVSGLLGFLASILGQIFQQWYSEYRGRSKIRRIIYSEIGAIYSMLVYLQPHVVSAPIEEEEADIRYKQNKLRERFLRQEEEGYAKKSEGEKYAEDHTDLFIQLEERSQIVSLYSAIHHAFSDDEEFGFNLRSGLAIEIIEDTVRFDWLPKKFVKRYMNPPDAVAIELAIQRRVASGHAVSDSEIASQNPYDRDPYE
jgi:hypothetical protein